MLKDEPQKSWWADDYLQPDVTWWSWQVHCAQTSGLIMNPPSFLLLMCVPFFFFCIHTFRTEQTVGIMGNAKICWWAVLEQQGGLGTVIFRVGYLSAKASWVYDYIFEQSITCFSEPNCKGKQTLCICLTFSVKDQFIKLFGSLTLTELVIEIMSPFEFKFFSNKALLTFWWKSFQEIEIWPFELKLFARLRFILI